MRRSWGNPSRAGLRRQSPQNPTLCHIASRIELSRGAQLGRTNPRGDGNIKPRQNGVKETLVPCTLIMLSSFLTFLLVYAREKAEDENHGPAAWKNAAMGSDR